MKTYDVKDSEGRVFAFEVSSIVGRSAVADAARAIGGAEVLESHASWFGPDEFCRFRVAGVEFCAWEPFGDSSHYWIGPVEGAHVRPETAIVRGAFQAYRPLRRVSRVTGVALLAGGVTTGVMSFFAHGEKHLGRLAAVMSVLGGIALWVRRDQAKDD